MEILILSIGRTAGSADEVHSKATASMYFFVLHVILAALLQNSDSFCVPATAAFTGAKHCQFSCFSFFSHSAFEGLVSPSSLTYVYQSISHPKCVSIWEKPFCGSTLALLLCFALHREKIHWADSLQKGRIEARNATTQSCSSAWLLRAKFLQRNQVLLSCQPKKWVWLSFAEYQGRDYRIGMQCTHEPGLQVDRVQTWTFQYWQN